MEYLKRFDDVCQSHFCLVPAEKQMQCKGSSVESNTLELWASVGEGLQNISFPFNTQRSKLEHHSMVYQLLEVEHLWDRLRIHEDYQKRGLSVKEGTGKRSRA